MSIWKDIIEAIRGTDQDFTKGKVGRAIILLAIPMVLEMIMESFFAIWDIFIVSHYGNLNPETVGSANAISVVGITESLLTIVYSVAVGLSMATTALVSRRIGEKDNKGASFSAGQAIILSTIVAILIAVPGYIFAEDLLIIMKADADVIRIGSSYTSIMMGGNIVIMLLFINNAILRSAGDAATSLLVIVVANGLNIILDPCLVFGWGPFPELGVSGAAVASNIGRGIGVIVQFYLLFRGTRRIKLLLTSLRVKLKILKELMILSIGGVGQFLIGTASWILLYWILGRFENEATAGYTISLRIIMFFLLPSWGLANATATLVGQNLGANNPERAEKSVWITTYVNIVYMFFIMLIFQIFTSYIISFFPIDDLTKEIGMRSLRIITLGMIFYGMEMVFIQAFNGAGDTYTPVLLNIICFWFIQIPVALILAGVTGLEENGVFWAIVIAEIILAVLALILFKRGKWKLKKV